MKVNNSRQLHDFIKTVEECEGSVWLESVKGDYYDLKDELDIFRGISALIDDKNEELELFAANRSDIGRLIGFIKRIAA